MIVLSQTFSTDCPIMFQRDNIFFFCGPRLSLNICQCSKKISYFCFQYFSPRISFQTFQRKETAHTPSWGVLKFVNKEKCWFFHTVFGMREHWWIAICMFIKVKFENVILSWNHLFFSSKYLTNSYLFKKSMFRFGIIKCRFFFIYFLERGKIDEQLFASLSRQNWKKVIYFQRHIFTYFTNIFLLFQSLYLTWFWLLKSLKNHLIHAKKTKS